MNMNINPVEINIKDNRKFGEVAFLVDREDFIKDLIRARKELGIKGLNTYGSDIGWSRSKESIVNGLLKNYHKDLSFRSVLIDAVFYGKVEESKISDNAYCTIIYPHEVMSDLKRGIAYPELAIIFSPNTKLEEIKEVYKTQASKLIGEYNKNVLKSKRKTPDTISNIKRDRKWYWQHVNGSSYQKIWEATKVKDRPHDREGVIKAVMQYRKRLAMDI